jgi:hypothetical protein
VVVVGWAALVVGEGQVVGGVQVVRVMGKGGMGGDWVTLGLVPQL